MSETLRKTMPSGTPDPYIAMLADSSRDAARMVLRWRVLEAMTVLGLARPVDALDDPGVGEWFFQCSQGCAPYGHAHLVVEKDPPRNTMINS